MGNHKWTIKLWIFTICYCLFAINCCFLLCGSATAAEMVIESDILEYDTRASTYTAKGNVKILRNETTINANEIKYNERSSEVLAEEDVLYIDPDVRIKASKAFINIEKNTGKLIDAEIFYKRENYHVKAKEIEKTSEKDYVLKDSAFTTCDAPIPAWCFKGRQVNILVDENIRAKDVTFNIKNLPVLYTPYLIAPLKDRKTGLLIPSIGYVESKGLHYEQPFFWAISDNRDVTITLDIYGKRATGEGIEYRHIEQNGVRGNYWVYHLKDDKFGSNFWDIKGQFDKRDGDTTAFISLNYINSLIYYREYNPYVNARRAFFDPASYLNITTGRFLESTAEVKYRFTDSSLTVQSRYLIDLKEGIDQSTVLQRLPEIGYFRYPEKIGPIVFTITTLAANFWREEGTRGQRLDIYPRFTLSSGSELIITQSLGLRATSYHLNSNSSDKIRTGLDYSITALTRLQKRYSDFTHIIEPSIDYTFIPSLVSDVPLFDSVELYQKTSLVNLSIMNRFISGRGEFLTLRITQPIDTERTGQPFLPMQIETALRGLISLRGALSYDTNTGKMEDLNSDLSLNISDLWLTMGQRYKRTNDILYYSFGLKWSPVKVLSYEGYVWYDAKTSNMKNIVAKINYQHQCWGITTTITKRERDYSFSVLFNLLGLGTVKI